MTPSAHSPDAGTLNLGTFSAAAASVETANAARPTGATQQDALERERLLADYRAMAKELTLHRLAVDHHAILCVFDGSGRIVSGNDNFSRAVDRPLHKLVGSDIGAIMRSGGMCGTSYAALWQQVRSKAVWQGELRLLGDDGQLRWLTTTIVPLTAKGGAVDRFMMAQTDITLLRRAEEALRAARQRELAVGALIQQRLLVSTEIPQLPGFAMSCFNQASQGIDGDFVEVFRSGPHSVDLVVGDVMGKGVNAALMGAAVKMQISRSMAELMLAGAQAGVAPQPAQIVAAMHRRITPNLQSLDAFVALTYLRLDLFHRTITWVGCGHEEAMLASKAGALRSLPNQQPPLGVLTLATFEQDQVAVNLGDVLLLHSDGLTDAMLASGERVGHDNLCSSFKRHASGQTTAGAVLHSVKRDVLQGSTLTDDLTLAVVRIDDINSTRAGLELGRNLAALTDLRHFVDGHLKALNIPEERAALFVVAVVEAFTNIVRHSTGVPVDAPIEVLAQTTPTELSVCLVCLGDAFTPPAELDDAHLQDLPEGGMGLLIMQRACKRVEYGHLSGVNSTNLVIATGGN